RGQGTALVQARIPPPARPPDQGPDRRAAAGVDPGRRLARSWGSSLAGEPQRSRTAGLPGQRNRRDLCQARSRTAGPLPVLRAPDLRRPGGFQDVLQEAGHRADHPRERHPRRTASLLRRRLCRDREHQGGRRPGRRRGQRRGQQRLRSDGRVETRAALGRRRRRRDSRLPRRRSSSGVDSGTMNTMPLDLGRLNVRPLVERDSLTCVENILLSPDAPPAACPELVLDQVRQCAAQVLEARKNGAGVILIYGAHLLRNGTARILGRMMERGWITHLATNGAGTIHDWEYAWLGRSTECVRANVATGTFGSWDETGRNIHLALLAGGLRDEGYGRALGRFIAEDGATIPPAAELEQAIRADPAHRLTPARADALLAILQHGIASGRTTVTHNWKDASILAQAFRYQVPMTVHPGIGYDIIANHPIYSGAVIGRAATHDFRLIGGSIETLDGGVVLSIGSAIMGPQVFEKSFSCVNNLRLQDGRPIVAGHSIHVVDLQDGGGWDWSRGEPPKTNPAYYLRFCKSYARMGGEMHYHQCDNAVFLHNLYHQALQA